MSQPYVSRIRRSPKISSPTAKDQRPDSEFFSLALLRYTRLIKAAFGAQSALFHGGSLYRAFYLILGMCWIFIGALLLVWGQKATGIAFFEGKWNDLLKEAQRLNRPIFVDFYAVWCGPCKMLERNTFSNPEVGSYVAKNYVAYRIDAERGEGPTLSNRFKIRAFPTLLFLDPTGQELGRYVGYVDAPTLLRLMTQYEQAYKKQSHTKPATWPDFIEVYQVYLSDVAREAWDTGFWATYEKWHSAITQKDWEGAQSALSPLNAPAKDVLEALTQYHRGQTELALRLLHQELFQKNRLSPTQAHWLTAYTLIYWTSPPPPEAYQWISFTIRKDPTSQAFLTQAALAYKLNRLPEAHTALKEAQREIPSQDPALNRLQQLVSTAKAAQH